MKFNWFKDETNVVVDKYVLTEWQMDAFYIHDLAKQVEMLAEEENGIMKVTKEQILEEARYVLQMYRTEGTDFNRALTKNGSRLFSESQVRELEQYIQKHA